MKASYLTHSDKISSEPMLAIRMVCRFWIAYKGPVEESRRAVNGSPVIPLTSDVSNEKESFLQGTATVYFRVAK